MSSPAPCFSFKSLRNSTSGAALVEFAIVLPLLVSLLFGATEMTRFIRARQHMETYATIVANDVSTLSSSLSAGTLREMIERIGLLAPELVNPSLPAWDASATKSVYLGVGISMATVTQTDSECHTGCAFQSKVVWSFGSNQRSCGVIEPLNIPVGANLGGPVVIVDINSTYQPAFGAGLWPGTVPTLSTSAFLPVKNWQGGATVPVVTPTSSGAWKLNLCKD